MGSNVLIVFSFPTRLEGRFDGSLGSLFVAEKRFDFFEDLYHLQRLALNLVEANCIH